MDFLSSLGKNTLKGRGRAKGSVAEGIEKTKGEEIIISLDRLRSWYNNQLS